MSDDDLIRACKRIKCMRSNSNTPVDNRSHLTQSPPFKSMTQTLNGFHSHSRACELDTGCTYEQPQNELVVRKLVRGICCWQFM